MEIMLCSHPSLDVRVFRADFPKPLGQMDVPDWLNILRTDTTSPFSVPQELPAAIRHMLRYTGFKPSGRSKPSSEYLANVAAVGQLPTINIAVDLCNAISRHSGLPVSVVDIDKLHPPLRIAMAADGQRYVFNASGQEIDVSKLICLHDAVGPCANPVKDAQRVKTTPVTYSTLTVLWGCRLFAEYVDEVERWYKECLWRLGVTVQEIVCQLGSPLP